MARGGAGEMNLFCDNSSARSLAKNRGVEPVRHTDLKVLLAQSNVQIKVLGVLHVLKRGTSRRCAHQVRLVVFGLLLSVVAFTYVCGGEGGVRREEEGYPCVVAFSSACYPVTEQEVQRDVDRPRFEVTDIPMRCKQQCAMRAFGAWNAEA